MTKIYADASYMHGREYGGIGIVFSKENQQESFAKTVTINDEKLRGSVVFEMVAIFAACVIFNGKNAVVFSDCLTAINYIHCKGGNQNYQRIAKKIRKIAKEKNITFRHIKKRSGNRHHNKADRLSKIKSGAI